MTVSPTDTFIADASPVSLVLPGPIATTSPCDGFSLAEPDKIIPPDEVSSNSVLLTRTLSCKGLKLIYLSI